MSYRIKKIWRTIQGEGHHTGTPCVFVRFVGCNLWTGYHKDRANDAARTGAHCPKWCDTDFTKEGAKAYTLHELVEEVQRVAGPHLARVVCTGGEPLLQIDQPLIARLQEVGFRVHIETNGVLALGDRNPDWVTVSPKLPENILKIERADELKLVPPGYVPDQYKRLSALAVHRFVQPEDGERYSHSLDIVKQIIEVDPTWRISVQTHKVLNMP